MNKTFLKFVSQCLVSRIIDQKISKKKKTPEMFKTIFFFYFFFSILRMMTWNMLNLASYYRHLESIYALKMEKFAIGTENKRTSCSISPSAQRFPFYSMFSNINYY